MVRNIDLGVAYAKNDTTNVKVTASYFDKMDQWYIHIREYILDGDTGDYYRGKGYAILAEEIDQIIEMAKKQKRVLNGILDETDENIIMTKRQNRSFQTRCSKFKNRAKAENRGEYIEICGMFTEGSALINSRNLIYRLDLCEKHFKEFTDKDI